MSLHLASALEKATAFLADTTTLHLLTYIRWKFSPNLTSNATEIPAFMPLLDELTSRALILQ
jgi:hypothetical protein